MSEFVEIQNEAATAEPEAHTEPVVEAVVEVPELRYSYQPTDEQGRPIGGLQVIKYRTHDELTDKLTKNSVELLRKLRSETRKNRLGISEDETIEAEAPRFQRPSNFSPRELSADDRVRISRDLLDPERFDEASDELFEVKIGVKPAELRRTLNELQEDRIAARAVSEVNAFTASNPEYVKCNENFEAITNWMLRYDLAPVKENFQKAYNKLRADGILIENAQAAQEEIPEQPVAVVKKPVVFDEQSVEQPEPVVLVGENTAPAVPAAPSAPAPRIPLSLSRTNSEDVGASPRSTGEDIVYDVVTAAGKRRYTGLAAINAMPADEYRRRTISDPTFSKREAALEKEAADRRKARR